MSNFTFDAQAATGFVVSQTAHIESEVNKTVYPDIQYPNLVPVDTSAHPMTQTVLYYSSDQVGKADWINANAADIPMVDTNLAEHKTSVYTAGVGYGFGWEEVQTAQMNGVNLSADRAMSARRAYEEMVDDIVLRGDTEKGFVGLINSGAVTAAAAVTGTWGTATSDQVLADVNAALLAVPAGTAYTAMADTLLMSPAKVNHLATTRLGDTSMTVLEFLRQNNTYTAMTGSELMIRAVRGLETAGAGSVERMVAYRRDPQVLKMHIPMPHRFFPVQEAGVMRWVVPGVFRLGGLDIRRPAEVRYVDGI